MVNFSDVAKVLENANTAGPVSEELIKDAEEKLQVRFPPSYRQFLSFYGAALFTGFEIRGLFIQNDTDSPPLWTDLITATNQQRRISRDFIPKEYIPISDDGGDYTFYLDTSYQQSDEECPVIMLGPGIDNVIIANDFLEFVVKAFKGKIKV